MMRLMEEPDFHHFFTTRQVADVFKVEVSTVNRWVQMGHLDSSRFGSGRTAPRAFNADDVLDFGEALADLHAARTTEQGAA